MIKRSLTILAAIVGLIIGFTASAYAVTYDVQTPGNWAGARYDSSTDTFTLWDNVKNDDLNASVFVNNVTKGSYKEYTHYWGMEPQSKRFKIPASWTSGNEIRFYVCATSIYDGSAYKCSGTKKAWV